jgi:hypothetical protein
MLGIAALFDHLVGSELQSGWHLETERLGSLKVDDDELEFDRLLHRQVQRFRVQISAALLTDAFVRSKTFPPRGRQ